MKQYDELVVKLVIEGMRQADKDIDNLRKSINKAKNGIRTSSKEVKVALQEVEKKSKTTSMTFQKNMMMMGFSALFTGMALTRVFSTIRNESFNVFNKLTANTQMANNAMARLNMATDYLKFTLADAINSAIEPMLPKIISIVESIVDWIENNSKLAGDLIIWGGIVSGAVMIAGQFSLAILGIIGAADLLFGVDLITWFSSLGGKIDLAIKSTIGITRAMDKLKGLGMIAIGAYLIYDGMTKLWDDGAFTNDLWQEIKVALGVAFGIAGVAKIAGATTILGGLPVAAVYPLAIGIAVTFHLFYEAFKVHMAKGKALEKSTDIAKIYQEQMQSKGYVDPWVKEEYNKSLSEVNILGKVNLWETAFAGLGIKTKDFKEAQEYVNASDEFKQTLLDSKWKELNLVQEITEIVENTGIQVSSASDAIALGNTAILSNVEEAKQVTTNITELVKEEEELFKKSNENVGVLASDEFNEKVFKVDANVYNIAVAQENEVIARNRFVNTIYNSIRRLNSSVDTSTR
jgi:hypothetical protein